jgi:hypothetical protein
MDAVEAATARSKELGQASAMPAALAPVEKTSRKR